MERAFWLFSFEQAMISNLQPIKDLLRLKTHMDSVYIMGKAFRLILLEKPMISSLQPIKIACPTTSGIGLALASSRALAQETQA
jgi:hypothetical protein